ncbi:hypothetical protein [Dactylosporangium matsuzakiense]|uniref:Uncharacterized protein n=1 Tax=Dactylosporangium matsuzakiense TaxID=53360 RepID=A0A9W6KYC6_9ACTN|nr:hypothetical protein [Dactylosporangium matsuzakiense]UWZ44611.1 hypothetical protein Dmats_45970 [Dactylosporangium matsuzakiense]GLL08690.1 hypothetical protein GCM10017581_104580 [Dactylosporangium matsuzakiense]
MSIHVRPWLSVALERDAVRVAVGWPDGTAMVVPPDSTGPAGPVAMPASSATRAAADARLLDELGALLQRVSADVAAIDGVAPGSATVAVRDGAPASIWAAARDTAAAAGLRPVAVASAGEAVCWHLLAGGVQIRPGDLVLVCTVDDADEDAGSDGRLGVACTAAVLQRAAGGFAVVCCVDASTVAADMRPIGAANGAMSRDDVVAEVARRAVAAAQGQPGRLAVVAAVGAGADEAVRRRLTAVCGVEPTPVADPHLAVVLGAVQRGPAGPDVPVEGIGGWRDVLAVLVPAAGSLALVGQVLAGSERYGPREAVWAPGMLLAPWGAVAGAAILGCIALIGGVSVAAAARHDRPAPHPDGRVSTGFGPLAWVAHRLVAAGLAAGAACALVLAWLYALLISAYFDLDIGSPARWSLLPILPIVAAVLALASQVWRRPHAPARPGDLRRPWLDWLRFPALASGLAAAGMVLIAYDETGAPRLLQPLGWRLEQLLPTAQDAIIGPIGRAGGACLGAAVAVLIVRRPLLRLLIGVPVALLIGTTAVWRTTGALAVGVGLAVAGWWAVRAAWLLIRPQLLQTPPPPPAPASATAGHGAPGSTTRRLRHHRDKNSPLPDHRGQARHGQPAARRGTTRRRCTAGRPGMTTSWQHQTSTMPPVSALRHPPAAAPGATQSFPIGLRVAVRALPPGPLTAPAAPRPPRRRGGRRRVVVAAAVAAALAMVGVAGVIRAANDTPSARQVVEEFFAALADHDGSRLRQTTAGVCDTTPLCTAAALTAGYEPPRDITVTADLGGDTSRDIRVAYTVGEQRITSVIAMTAWPRTSMFGGPLWSIHTAPGTHLLAPTTTPAPMTIAATTLPTRPPEWQNPNPDGIWAPPGRYTIARHETPLLDGAAVTLDITDTPTATVTLPAATLKPAAATAAEQLIRDRIDTCATQHRLSPDIGGWHTCPMSYPANRFHIEQPTWTIQSYPQLTFDPTDDGTMQITTTTPGQAAITFQWSNDFTEAKQWHDTTDTVNIKVKGTVAAAANGTLDWHPA